MLANVSSQLLMRSGASVSERNSRLLVLLYLNDLRYPPAVLVAPIEIHCRLSRIVPLTGLLAAAAAQVSGLAPDSGRGIEPLWAAAAGVDEAASSSLFLPLT